MLSRRVPVRCFLLSGFALLGAGTAEAQLAAKSPFMAPQAAAVSAPVTKGPLEFVGYIATSEGVRFRLFDPAKKAGAWVTLNEKNPELDVLVKQHDVQQKTLLIEYQGRTITLAERESKVVSSGSAAQMSPPPPMPAPAPTVAPAVTQSVVLNPSPADEQRRLEAVAAEVARRRAMREQATQQIGQAMPPPPSLPPPNLPSPNQGRTPGTVNRPPR